MLLFILNGLLLATVGQDSGNRACFRVRTTERASNPERMMTDSISNLSVDVFGFEIHENTESDGFLCFS